MSTAARFLDVLEARDFVGLRHLLDDAVWCRAMMVREIVELHDAAATVELFESWYATPAELALEERQHHVMMGRELVRYRMRLRPHWAPECWHRIEQVGYLTARDDRIRRIDLTCTGFFPI